MTTHRLEISSKSLQNTYSTQHNPVLIIQSGDTVISETLDAGWGLEAPHLDKRPRRRHPKFATLEQRGHALTGPIWIKGATVGKTLCVQFDDLQVGDFGYTYAGGFTHRIHQHLDLVDQEEFLLLWKLNHKDMTGTNQYGHRVRLAPFLGNFGMPPPEVGYHSTASPRIWGGNIDCRELVAGSRIYLPIPIEGGLFYFGDGHAIQGHGEVSVTAVECPMQQVTMTFDVLDDFPLPTPCAWTEHGWLTFGYDENLERASLKALDAMLDVMVHERSLSSRQHALALASAIVDLHITQIANPIVGVHALMAHDSLL